MSILPILTYKEPVLRTKAQAVTVFDDDLATLISDMWETMRAAPGVGLAAPQIGKSIRVLVAAHQGVETAIVNPTIVEASDEERLGTEGCLSVKEFIGVNIRRKAWVVVEGCNVQGEVIRVRAEEWFARILQHEIDHLDGILFMDRLDSIEDLRLKQQPVASDTPAPEPELVPARNGASAPVGSSRKGGSSKGANPSNKSHHSKRTSGVKRSATSTNPERAKVQSRSGSRHK